MDRPRYVAADTEPDFESRRLGLLETISDPRTRERIESLGIRPGWNCLEVGAGAGSIVRWLADRVAPTGHVVATDVDTRFLDSLDVPGVEVRRHNILTDHLETDRFDLVHCRALLLHLPDRQLALARMFAALRPGGWLFVEDLDVTTMRAADPAHPFAADFDTRQQRDVDFIASLGIFDPSSARRVPGMLAALELHEAGHVGLTGIIRGGEPAALFYALGSEMMRPLLVGHGIASDAEVDAQIRTLNDPSFSFTDTITYQYWGRKKA